MKIKEIKILRSVLSKEIGRTWPVFLLKCMIKNRSIFNKTHWVGKKKDEVKFVKRFSLASAIYLELQNRFDKNKAFEIIRKMLVPIGCDEQWNHLKSLNLGSKTPKEKLIAFNDLMDEKGTPKFNKREHIRQDENIRHFVIKRCVFKDFFTEAGTPKLTKLFCEVDREFFPKAFPELKFHRNGLWENTIAYGKDHCEFVFGGNENVG